MFLGVSEKYVYPQDIVIQIGNFMFRTSGWNGVPYFQTNPDRQIDENNWIYKASDLEEEIFGRSSFSLH